MRALSNNRYQKSLPFTNTQVHSNKLSDDDTGYDSSLQQIEKQPRITGQANVSSSSSSHQCDRVVSLVAAIPSPTDVSTTNDNSELVLKTVRTIEKFSTLTQTPMSIRKINRTRIQPIPDSTSDSTDSIALSNRVVYMSPKSAISSDEILRFGKLEYIHDNRFKSTTTVSNTTDHIVAVGSMERQKNLAIDLKNKQQQSWISHLGESIQSLPANVLATVFIVLISSLCISAIFIIIIA